ncbi:MAG TPA: NAD(+) kinase, partial [Gammaproteobacteria bacterium]
MVERFKTIGLIGKYADTTVGATLHTLGSYLKGRGLHVLLDEATAEVWPEHGLETASRERIGHECD